MFLALAAAVAAERIFELARSRSHIKRMRGAVVAEPLFPLMVAVHAGTLVAAPLEHRLRARPLPRGVRIGAGLALAGATLLRVWALSSLGEAWSVRVTRSRRRPVITAGPYRYLRHPNYLAVILELASLPLIGSAWLTALCATLTNAWVLSRRIPLEEKVLFADRRYRRHFRELPRLFPR